MSKEMFITKLAGYVATALAPKIATDIYEYLAENIKELVPESKSKPKPIKQSSKKFTDVDIKWIVHNYHCWLDTGTTINGIRLDTKEEFGKYCNDKFQLVYKKPFHKTFDVYKRIGTSGANYYKSAVPASYLKEHSWTSSKAYNTDHLKHIPLTKD